MTDLGYSIYEQTFNSLGDDSYDHPAAKKERTPGSGSTGPAAGPGGGGLPPVWPGAVRVGNMSLVGLRGAGHGSGEEANHMPNRVIRDSILTSRQVARLDWFQQALFVRLILGCDDYGRYYGAPDIICGHLFSTSSGVTQELVAEGLEKLEEEGLIVTYQVGEKPIAPCPSGANTRSAAPGGRNFPLRLPRFLYRSQKFLPLSFTKQSKLVSKRHLKPSPPQIQSNPNPKSNLNPKPNPNPKARRGRKRRRRRRRRFFLTMAGSVSAPFPAATSPGSAGGSSGSWQPGAIPPRCSGRPSGRPRRASSSGRKSGSG